MEPIRVKPYPMAAFDTPEGVIAHAKSHPQLPDARLDATQLEGTVFVDACWTLFDWIIRFDCGKCLCVSIDTAKISWEIRRSETRSISEGYQNVGALPVLLDWSGSVGVSEMDCTSLVSKRRGARFKDLFIADYGLLIYLCGAPILQLSPIERLSDGRSILYACDSD